MSGLSPFARHRQAAIAAAVSGGDADTPRNASGYELMLVKLAEDRRRLKDLQSVEAKAELKRQILPDYAGWIEGVLEHGRGAQDDVITTVMLWSVDAGLYQQALDIGAYVLRYQLSMPDQFERSAQALLVEEIADAAKRARDAGQPFDADLLHCAMELTNGLDMHDQIRAKAHKELGLLLDDPAERLRQLQRAQELNANAGVKKDIQAAERAIKNAAASQQAGS